MSLVTSVKRPEARELKRAEVVRRDSRSRRRSLIWDGTVAIAVCYSQVKTPFRTTDVVKCIRETGTTGLQYRPLNNALIIHVLYVKGEIHHPITYVDAVGSSVKIVVRRG